MRAINIEWDTDGNQEVFEDLPKEIEIPEWMTDEDQISDYLTDKTGFCHLGFVLEGDADDENVSLDEKSAICEKCGHDLGLHNDVFQAFGEFVVCPSCSHIVDVNEEIA